MTEPDPNAVELALRLFPETSSWCRVCFTRLQIVRDGRHFRLFCRRCKKWRRGRTTSAMPPPGLPADE